MKKLLFVFFALLMCAQISFARIQTKVLGCRLGETSQSEAIAILQNQGFEFETESVQIMSTSTFFFNGREWNTLLVEFYQGKVMRISMFLFDGEKSTDKCRQNYLAMAKKFRRYNRYFDGSSSDPTTRCYKDDATELTVSYQDATKSGSDAPSMAMLLFTDLKLQGDQKKAEVPLP